MRIGSVILIALALSAASSKVMFPKKQLNTFNYKDADAFVFGLAEGLRLDQDVENSTACMTSTRDAAFEIYTASDSFVREWHSENRLNNWFNTAKSFQTMSPMIKTCYDVGALSFDHWSKHFKQFHSWVGFFKSFISNLVGQLFNIQTYINSFQKALDGEKKDFALLGKTTGQLIHSVFIFQNTSPDLFAAEDNSEDLIDTDYFKLITDFTNGFLEGSQVFNTPNMTKCVDSFINLDQLVISYVNNFAKGDHKNGVYDLADTFGSLYPLSFHCHYGGEEMVSNAMEHKEIREDPLQIVYHIIYHFGEIFDDMRDMIHEALNGMDMTVAGKKFGDMIYKILFVESDDHDDF